MSGGLLEEGGSSKGGLLLLMGGNGGNCDPSDEDDDADEESAAGLLDRWCFADTACALGAMSGATQGWAAGNCCCGMTYCWFIQGANCIC